MAALIPHQSLLAGLAAVFIWTSLLEFAHAGGSADRELLPYEPLQYVKTVSPPVDEDSTWKGFVELSAQEAGDLATEMRKKLKSVLAKSGTSVVFAKGERVFTQRRSVNLKWNSTIELPHANTLSLISALLPILLEGYKHGIISDPIGKVLKGEDLKKPLVKGHESTTFLDLLNKLPKYGKPSLDLDSTTLLTELDKNGKLAVYFVNTVLGQSAKEAWTDALIAIGMEEMQFSKNGHLLVNLQVLLQYILTVDHDINLLGRVPKSEIISPDKNHFLFGWWQNCPKSKSDTSECLFSALPEDTIFTLSPDLRIYISPSLELSMIVTSADASPDTANEKFPAKKVLKTVNDIIETDGQIWAELQTIASGESSSQSSSKVDGASDANKNKKEKGSRQEQKRETSDTKASKPAEQEAIEDPDQPESQLAKWIHWCWPTTVFVFWVTVSHVWVYWLFHCCWFVVTRFSKRAHIPRPKTASDAR